MHLKYLPSIAVLVTAIAPIAARADAAYIQECAKALEKSEIQNTDNTVMRYAASMLGTDISDRQDQWESGGSYGAISGYLNHRTNDLSVKQETREVRWSSEQAKSYLSAFIPPNGYKSFNDCLATVMKRPGVYIDQVSMSNDASAVTIGVSATLPMARSKWRLVIKTNGETSDKYVEDIDHATGRQHLTINWPNPSKDLLVTAAVYEIKGDEEMAWESDTRSFPPNIMVRAVIEPDAIKTKQSSDTSCGGAFPASSAGPDITLYAPPNSDLVNIREIPRQSSQGGAIITPPTMIWKKRNEREAVGYAMCNNVSKFSASINNDIMADVRTYYIEVPNDNGAQMTFKVIPGKPASASR